jgi:hypothetical protein
MTCSTCRGTKIWQSPSGQWQACPSCDGSGQQWDPGREFTYEIGPFTLNAYAAAAPTNSQNIAGTASTANFIKGASCQVGNYPFRVEFWMAKSTFPFTIVPYDAGSGSGRSFVPIQSPVHSENLFGNSRHPMPWPTPYIFQRNQNITADFTDLGGATGFVSVTNGSPNVTWISGGQFNTSAAPGPPFPGVSIWAGQQINIGGTLYVISSAAGSGVTSQTTLVLASNYLGATNANIAYAVSNSIRVAFKGQELSNPSSSSSAKATTM